MTVAHPTLCPTCGQALPPAGLALPRIKRRILDAVQRRPGISAEELRVRVWGDDPNGGPESAKCLHAHVWQLNEKLAPLGLAVRGSVSGGYRLLQKSGRAP